MIFYENQTTTFYQGAGISIQNSRVLFPVSKSEIVWLVLVQGTFFYKHKFFQKEKLKIV